MTETLEITRTDEIRGWRTAVALATTPRAKLCFDKEPLTPLWLFRLPAELQGQ